MGRRPRALSNRGGQGHGLHAVGLSAQLCPGSHLEKQRLPDHRLQRLRVERLCDQERGLWPGAGQERLRMPCDENDGRLVAAEDFVHGIKAGTAIRQLDVREDELRPVALHERKRLLVRAGEANDAMAKAFHQVLKVESRERLVLDNQDAGRIELARDFPVGRGNELANLVNAALQDRRDFLRLEPFER